MTDETILYACPINGKRCCNGVREDFTAEHPISGEKLKCAKWVGIRGMNPQTGQEVDNFMCTDVAFPLLLIENSQQQRQTAASVDKVANQLLRQRAEFIGALPEEAQERLTRGGSRLLENSNGNT